MDYCRLLGTFETDDYKGRALLGATSLRRFFTFLARKPLELVPLILQDGTCPRVLEELPHVVKTLLKLRCSLGVNWGNQNTDTHDYLQAKTK